MSAVTGLGVETVAAQVPAAADAVSGPEQLIVGAVLSTRLTVNVHEAVLPEASWAVSVTVVAPTPVTVEPTDGDWVTIIALESVQLSLTVASDV